MSAEARVASVRAQDTRAALARLQADGFVVETEQRLRTSRSFQRAMAKAAVKLYDDDDPGEDLRVPIALALLEAYGGAIDDETLASLVEAMLPIESASLGLSGR